MKLQPIYHSLEIRLLSYCAILRYHFTKILVSKPKLLGLISVITLIIFVPLIIPHIHRPHLIYFISMHVASITISTFLIVASLLAYHRTNSSKILYTTVGFSSLLIVELLFSTRSNTWNQFRHAAWNICRIAPYATITYADSVWFGRLEGGKIDSCQIYPQTSATSGSLISRH